MLRPYFVLVLFFIGTSIACSVFGQDYPNKPVRIVTSVAGGSNDIIARIVGQGWAPSLGQPIVIDNRTGIIPMETLIKATPDGYTLLFAGAITWIFPLVQKVPYDVLRDLAPISLLAKQINVIVVAPSLPVNSVKDLIALAKAKPGALNYSSSGTAGPQHIAVELFKSMAGINIVRVPYKGSIPAMTAVLNGEAQLTFTDPGVAMPQVKAGKLRVIAVTSSEPSALVPGVPTVAASGLPGYEAIVTTGMFGPAKMPPSIVTRINQELVRVVNLPEVKEKFLAGGAEPVGSSPEQFTALIKAEIARIAKVIEVAGIKAD